MSRRRCTTHSDGCPCKKAELTTALAENSLFEFEIKELRRIVEYYRDRTSIGGVARDCLIDLDARLAARKK